MSFFQNFGCLVFVFEFIDFRPGRDFINVRGLFIQGGDCIYIYIWDGLTQIEDCDMSVAVS